MATPRIFVQAALASHGVLGAMVFEQAAGRGTEVVVEVDETQADQAEAALREARREWDAIQRDIRRAIESDRRAKERERRRNEQRLRKQNAADKKKSW